MNARNKANRAAPKYPYCMPQNAGLASEPPAVARRLARLLNALDTEITGYVVDQPSKILDEVTVLKRNMLERLRAEGWRVEYSEAKQRWTVLRPLNW